MLLDDWPMTTSFPCAPLCTRRVAQIAAAVGALTLVAIFLVANSASDLEMAAYNVPVQQVRVL